MSEGGGGGIFISYRREESGHVAGRLSDRLIDRFGPKQVFIDVEAIEPGADFGEVIERAVGGCAVLLAVIGPSWLRAADERGGRRLDDADDMVRLEIAAALARGVRVIPVLVEGAVMPRRDELPEDLAPLTRRNALRVRHESFRDDAQRLVRAIERALAGAAPGTASDGAASSQSAEEKFVPAVRALVERAETARPSPAAAPAAGQQDLPRAARLVSEAERLAAATPDSTAKARALCRVAEAAVVTDPAAAARLVAQAERILKAEQSPFGGVGAGRCHPR
jgi:hypothetical protein